MTLKDLARQAKEKAGDFSVNDFCQYIFDSTRKQELLTKQASESYARFAAMDHKEIYAHYAASINQPVLTADEKTQAILEHILNEGEDYDRP